MSSTPRPSQKKQATLTSFFTPKSNQGSHAAPSSSPAPPLKNAASPSLPSRKRPLEEDADRGNNGSKDGGSKKRGRAKSSSSKPKAAKRVRSESGKPKNAEVEAEEAEAEAPEPAPAPAPSSPLRSSGRTERYLYENQAENETAQDEDEDEDDEATRRKKEELHRKFVKKLGGPDSLAHLRRRNWFLGLDATAPGSGKNEEGEEGEEGEEEEEEEAPAPVKGKKKGKLTPMEVQFLDIKRRHMDTLLVVEVGYKFRFFGEDARTAARTLGIVCVPGKLRYDEDPHGPEAHLDRFASASIPVPRLGVHVRRLVAAGHKVGVVRQMETAALKKAGDNRNAPFVRKLTNVYTKGTYIEEEELTGGGGGVSGPSKPSGTVAGGYLLCLTERKAQGSGTDERVEMGVLAVQAATGDIVYDQFEDGFLRNELETRLLHIAPVELVLVGPLSRATEKLVQHLSGSAANVFGDRTRVERIEKAPAAGAAHAHVVQFYASQQKDDVLDQVLGLSEALTVCLSAMITHLGEYGLEHVFALTRNFGSFTTRQHMLLSGTTLESLEVYRNATDHGLHGSLLWALDKTQTRAGHRLLRKWIGRPLLDAPALAARADAVEELLKAAGSAQRDRLDGIFRASGRTDLERSLIRIYYGRCTRPELVAGLEALRRIAGVYGADEDSGFVSALIQNSVAALPAMGPVVEGFLSRIDGEAARRDDKYAFFREAEETDAITNHKVGIAAVEMDLEAQRQEIGQILKKKKGPPAYVTVAGIEYLVEVPNSELRQVPASWVKISGTKKVSRFHTPAVVRLLGERDQHREALAAACDAAFVQLLADVAAQYQPLRDAVAALATLDGLLSLARVAALPGYVRPTIVADDTATGPMLAISGGRHPVAEHTLPGGYIPFSTELGQTQEDGQSPEQNALTLLVTGPNMGGKSSFVRAVALLTLLAQIGSFVPATSMRLTLADAVFTRMGAHDNLFAGESTFMVELSETAAILRAATPRSLVLLDELGRGTSTHDGTAIAHAVLDHLARERGCRALFITHYQGLARVADGLRGPTGQPLVRNVHMRFTATKRDDTKDVGADKADGDDKSDDADKDDDNLDITFLYEVAPGVAHRSYGLNVARLARIPQRVLDVAARKSREMEHDLRVRRLHATTRLAADILSRPDVSDDALDHLVSSIEQL